MTIHAPNDFVSMYEPWFSAFRKAATTLNAIRIKQAEIVLLTGRFLTERFDTCVQYGANAEQLSQKLNELTDRYLETCAGQLSAIRRSWMTLCSLSSTSIPLEGTSPEEQAPTTSELKPEGTGHEGATDVFPRLGEVSQMHLAKPVAARTAKATPQPRTKLRRVASPARRPKAG